MAKLKRDIGLVALTLFGVGDILGAGIYGLIGKAAGQMGNMAWAAFLTSLIAAGLTGLSYASLGSRYPKAGGASYVSLRAFRQNWIAYFVGLAVLASGLTSMATATRAFSGYFHGLFGGVPLPFVIIGFGVLLSILVIRGIKESLWTNALLTLIELVGLLIVILVGIRFVGSVDYLSAQTATNPSGDLSLGLLLSGAVLTFYSFVGFEDMLNVGEEVKEAEKNLPRAMLMALICASIIYMLISVVAVSVLPVDQLGASSEPLVEVVAKAAPWFPSHLFSIIAMFAVANTALLNYIMGSRLMYGMARDRLLPSPLSQLHPKRQTPHIAALVILAIFLGLALIGDISALARATSVLLLLSFTTVNIALVVLKQRPDEKAGRFEIPTLVPIAGAGVCLLLLFSAETPELTISAIALVVIGLLYFILRPKEVLAQKKEE